MKRVLLDTNIYDKINESAETKTLINKLVKSNKIKILKPDSVGNELANSPLGRKPGIFPTEDTLDSAFILDHSRLDYAKLGPGDVFASHLGESAKYSDAVIADSASKDADIFVSEDNRLRHRLSKIDKQCTVLDFNGFLKLLRNEFN